MHPTQHKMALKLLSVVVSALSLLSLRSTAAAATSTPSGGKPLVTAITRDAATKLYTAPLKDALPLVLDLSGPLLWSTCAAARPYSPFGRRAEFGDLSPVHVTANATDGANPLGPVSFTAVAACVPPKLLVGLPAGAVGVAGLSSSKLALPAQVAREQNVARKFALCLPGDGNGLGVAIFGGGPLSLLPPGRPDFTASLAGTTPLHANPRAPGYFISAKGIAVNHEQVQVQQLGPLVVGLSSRVPYTVLRPDVYAPFVRAFDTVTAGMKRVTPPPPPFELCYDSRQLGSTRLGYAVPQVDLMLESGATWTVFGANSMVQVSDSTACFAFLEMKEEKQQGRHEYGDAAVVIGGFQMENNLLVFDEENGQLGFSALLFGRQTTCSNFNFTLAG